MVLITFESASLLKSGFIKNKMPSPAPSSVKALTKMMNTMTLQKTVTNTIILKRSKKRQTPTVITKLKRHGILHEHDARVTLSLSWHPMDTRIWNFEFRAKVAPNFIKSQSTVEVSTMYK